MRVGTFYQHAADPGNVSGFRYACADLLRGLVESDEIERLYVFALAPGPALGGARCTWVDLTRLGGMAALGEAPVQVLHEMEHQLRRPLAARARLRRPVPVSIGTHGNRLGAAALTGFYLPLLLGDLGPADRVICASQVARAAFVRHLDLLRGQLAISLGDVPPCPAGVEVIPLGVDTGRFAPVPGAEARAALGLPEARYVLWHGRVDLRNKQDPGPVLMVMRRLLHEPAHADVRLLVSTTEASPDVELLRLRAQHLGIDGRVDVLRGVPRERVPLLYAASAAALCLSDTPVENFGLTALEAMACGVPVIAADWAGWRDIIKDGETGLLVPTLWSEYEEEVDLLDALGGASATALVVQGIAADCAALERALRAVLGDSALAARLGEAGMRRVHEQYDVRTMVRRHVALWRQMDAEAERSAPARPVLRARLLDVVAHYPSALLQDVDRVALSADGRALLGGEPICLPPLEGQPIEEAPLRALLRGLARRPDGQDTSVAEVLGAAGRGPLGPALRRHLMWLIKQGYVDHVRS